MAAEPDSATDPERWREHARWCVENMSDWPADFPGPDDSPPTMRSPVCFDADGIKLWVDSIVLVQGHGDTLGRVIVFQNGGVLVSFVGDLHPQIVPPDACTCVLP